MFQKSCKQLHRDFRERKLHSFYCHDMFFQYHFGKQDK